jgi:hypothetical protein
MTTEEEKLKLSSIPKIVDFTSKSQGSYEENFEFLPLEDDKIQFLFTLDLNNLLEV